MSDMAERRQRLYATPCTYLAAHQRIYAARGKASQWYCIGCGAPAEQWAYQNGSPREQRGDVERIVRGRRTIAHLAWSPDPADYVPMCARCHGIDTRPDYGAGYRQDPDRARAKRREWAARSYARELDRVGLDGYRARKNRERRLRNGSPDGWLTTTQVAARLGVHVNTVIRRADAGQIPHTRTRGGDRRFDPAAIEQLTGKKDTP